MALSATLDPELLRRELSEMRNAHMASAGSGVPMGAQLDSRGVVTDAMRAYDSLTATEQQAASLGVHPESFKPLKDLNEQHFEALRQANALSTTLEANIRAFRAVSEQVA